jgi:ankyrin repeat protein
MQAALNGNLVITRALLAKSADVNAVTKDGETALMMAAAGGHHHVMRALIRHGANINAKNKDDRTALMLAASNGEAPAVTVLLDQPEIDRSARDRYGDTALSLAARADYIVIVQLLVRSS